MHNFRNLVTLGLFLAIAVNSSSHAAEKQGYYGYGKAASAAEIAGWDIDVRPDGMGLPPGSGSVEDGEMLYENQCAECHGSFGEGVGRFPVLAGGEGSLTEARPSKTVGSFWAHTSTLWDYIHRSMPFTSPQSLSDDEVYAIVAYVLYLNDIVDDDFELNQSNLADVEMPNKPNFVADPRPDTENVRCMDKCKDPASVIIASSSVPLEVALDKSVPAEAEEIGPGQLVYNQNCAICHSSGVGGAPIVGDEADWKLRISAGMLTLKQHAIRGFEGSTGIMPPKGGFMNLEDEQVDGAVEFMVESSE